jgi:hypothetical protein
MEKVIAGRVTNECYSCVTEDPFNIRIIDSTFMGLTIVTFGDVYISRCTFIGDVNITCNNLYIDGTDMRNYVDTHESDHIFNVSANVARYSGSNFTLLREYYGKLDRKINMLNLSGGCHSFSQCSFNTLGSANAIVTNANVVECNLCNLNVIDGTGHYGFIVRKNKKGSIIISGGLFKFDECSKSKLIVNNIKLKYHPYTLVKSIVTNATMIYWNARDGQCMKLSKEKSVIRR